MTDTFFEPEAGRGGVPRDYEGNALILPRDATTDRLVPYTSASGLADFITDDRHIHRWELRNLAKGMGMSPDLCELAATEIYSTGFDAPTGRAKSASGRRLDTIVERAHDRVRLHEKADHGTAIHAWTEPGNAGIVSERAKADVAAFWACIKDNGIKIGATEVFTANDELRAAGTFDHLCWIPGYGWVITDKKTGKMNIVHFEIQLVVYADGEIYDPATKQRAPLESLTGGQPIDRNTGIVFDIGDGKCELREVDLEHGRQGALAAMAARDYHASTGSLGDATSLVSRSVRQEREILAKEIRACQDRTAALALWRQYEHLWTDEHSTLAKGLPA